MREGEPVEEVEVRRRHRLAADRLAHALDGQRRTARLDEQPRQQLRGGAVVVVARRHALQHGDRLSALAGECRGLAALVRTAGASVQLGRVPALAELLEQRRRRLQVPGVLERAGRAVLQPRPQVDATGGRPALARLIRTGGLGHHPDRLVQLGRAQEVVPMHEPRGRVGRAIAFERRLAAQHRRTHSLAGLVERLRRTLLVPRAQEQLGRLAGLSELEQRLGRFAVEAALPVHDHRAGKVARLLVQPTSEPCALVVRRVRGRGVGRRVRHVLGEVLLVRLRGSQRLAVLLPGLGRTPRVAALLVQLGGGSPLLGETEQARGLQVVALLQEQRGGARRFSGGGEQGRALLVVAGLQEQLGRALGAPELLVGRGSRPGLLPVDVRLGGGRELAGVLQQLARGQVVADLLEPRHLAAQLLLRPARAQEALRQAVGRDRRARDADAHAVRYEAIDEQEGDDGAHAEDERVVEQADEKFHPEPVHPPARAGSRRRPRDYSSATRAILAPTAAAQRKIGGRRRTWGRSGRVRRPRGPSW